MSIVQMIKTNIYNFKLKKLLVKGIKSGEVTQFSDELYKQMSQTFVAGLPVSIHIRYLNPTSGPGKCLDRSLYMFFCFDNALLVRGDCEDLAMRFGSEDSEHGWIEIDDYVYDSSLLLRFKKDLYYELYRPTNVVKCSKDEYCSTIEQKKAYDEVRNTTIDDFKPHGKRRLELGASIPLARIFANNSKNKGFMNELNEFISLIEYDEEEIQNEMNERFQKVFGSKTIEK